MTFSRAARFVAPAVLLTVLLGCSVQPMAPRSDAQDPQSAPAVDAAKPRDAEQLVAEPWRRGHPRNKPNRLLMIGNSLTDFNDLPEMVAALSRGAGDDPPLEVESVTLGGAALEDHLLRFRTAERKIAEGNWDVVSLQQGPSTLPASRTNLIQYTRLFAELIWAQGGRPALYGVWPEQARSFAFDDCIESYRLAAEAVNGMLFPAGKAWKAAWRRDPSLPLYGSDRFHPSRLGSYLAALVIYAELRDKSPVGLPRSIVAGGVTYTFSEQQALTVQLAAEEVTCTGSKRRPGKPWGPRWPHADVPCPEESVADRHQ